MLSNIELLCRVDCRQPMPACQQDGVNPEEKLERFVCRTEKGDCDEE